MKALLEVAWYGPCNIPDYFVKDLLEYELVVENNEKYNLNFDIVKRYIVVEIHCFPRRPRHGPYSGTILNLDNT